VPGCAHLDHRVRWLAGGAGESGQIAAQLMVGDKASLIQDAGEDRIGTGDQVLRFGRVFHVTVYVEFHIIRCEGAGAQQGAAATRLSLHNDLRGPNTLIAGAVALP
jgi:hypothetical protein